MGVGVRHEFIVQYNVTDESCVRCCLSVKKLIKDYTTKFTKTAKKKNMIKIGFAFFVYSSIRKQKVFRHYGKM